MAAKEQYGGFTFILCECVEQCKWNNFLKFSAIVKNTFTFETMERSKLLRMYTVSLKTEPFC